MPVVVYKNELVLPGGGSTEYIDQITIPFHDRPFASEALNAAADYWLDRSQAQWGDMNVLGRALHSLDALGSAVFTLYEQRMAGEPVSTITNPEDNLGFCTHVYAGLRDGAVILGSRDPGHLAWASGMLKDLVVVNRKDMPAA